TNGNQNSSSTNGNQNSASTNNNNSSVSIVLNPTSAVVDMGETKAISVIVTPASKQNSVKWSSLDANIATVSGGLVTGVSAGTTTIVAEVDSVKATCIVQVNQTYGSVTGNVTYYYNKYQGNKPDTGTMVFLISKSGSAKNMPIMNSYVIWSTESTMKQYESYGIYTTKVDGSGNYTFNNIPTGDYLIFMYSSKTTSGTAFSNKEAYVSQIASSVSGYVNETNAEYLGKIVGYQKYHIGNVTVSNNKTVTESYDFGTTYV
ncbi:MAG: Ig-like domain-containing protein, partial [Lachnospiraceae bacterium]|nr:Ig-like domain-containing protein [Lachnospiraceae bacterium]